jgi:hypothetical protein
LDIGYQHADAVHRTEKPVGAVGIGDDAILAEADLVFASTAAVDLDQMLRLAPTASQV